jgi:hypothetical protein
VFLSIVVMSMPYQEFGLGVSGAGMLVGAIIGGAISLALHWWIFFGEQIWAKWTCLGCTGLVVVFGLIGMLNPEFSSGPSFESLGMAGVQTFMFFLNLCFIAWFASIVYRDIQNRQLS